MKLLDLQRSGFDRKGFFCIFALFVLVVAKRGGEGGEGGGIVVRRGGGGVALGLAGEKKSEPGEKGRGRRRGVGRGRGRSARGGRWQKGQKERDYYFGPTAPSAGTARPLIATEYGGGPFKGHVCAAIGE